MAHDIADLYPQLRIELPGIPEPVLADGVTHAVDEFLMDSEVYKYSIPTLLDWTMALVFPGIVQAVEIPANTRVVRIDQVKYANDGTSFVKVPFRTRQEADAEYPSWEVDTGSAPLIWTNDGPDTPVISPIATADVLTSLKIRVVLGSAGPLLTTLPDFIIHEFGDVIKHAALARLMKMPGKDWTNMNGAAGYASQYKVGAIRAKSRAEADFGQPVKRVMAYGGI